MKSKKDFIATHRGFTLIELLVVIAIIGILSGIVLTSLNSARGKAEDSKIAADLSGLRTAAEIYYSENGDSYGTGDCSSAMFVATSISPYLQSSATPTCVAEDQTFAVSGLLGDGSTPYCVDSSGFSGKDKSAQIDTDGQAKCL